MPTIANDYSLLTLNTFGLNSSAKHFISIDKEEDLAEASRFIQDSNLPYMVLGGGSNILFANNFPGIILYNQIKGMEVLDETESSALFSVGGGENWHETVLESINRGFQGMENLSLIPGSTGASPVQNIGAYGVELKDIFYQLSATHLESGEKKTFTPEECDFGYRNSYFKTEEGKKWFITNVVFRLNKLDSAIYNVSYGAIESELEKMGNPKLSPKVVSDAVIAIRSSKLPDPKEIGNCGSFFKNPVISLSAFTQLKERFPEVPSYPIDEQNIKVPAGWLIETSGLKGCKIGNVGTYGKQALVLVNLGGATGDEAVEAANQIRTTVLDKTGIEIEPEVTIL